MIKQALLDTFNSLPKSILRKLLNRKLEEKGIAIPREAIDALADHVLSGQKSSFVWDDGVDGAVRNLSLDFTEDDGKEIDAAINRAINALPDAASLAVEKASELLFKTLKRRWKDEYLAQQYELQAFAEGIEERWGEGLNYLRMLLTCCREAGAKTLKRHKKSKSKRHALRRWVLVRLHARACQVANEIICLMENGFADGALARWRTLYELSVVATIIADGDEDLAERYIRHDAVEVRRQADDYEASQVPLGFAPISKQERKAIDREYLAVLNLYGPTFAYPYGWAANHLSQKKPTFKDLQSAAKHAGMNSYYKLASFNVHAGARSLFFNLSAMGDHDFLLAGRSNAGFEEPRIRTAHSLVLITSLYVGETTDFDQISILKCLIKIRDAVGPALHKAARLLLKDERSIRKTL